MFVIGVDEAGYGPNLGPLVVSATVWEIPDAADEFDFYERLKEAVATAPCDDERVVIADSKQLFKPGGDWRRLERGVGAALRLLDASPGGWRALWQRLDGE